MNHRLFFKHKLISKQVEELRMHLVFLYLLVGLVMLYVSWDQISSMIGK